MGSDQGSRIVPAGPISGQTKATLIIEVCFVLFLSVPTRLPYVGDLDIDGSD